MSLIKPTKSPNWHIKFYRHGVRYYKSSGTPDKERAAQIEKNWKESLFRMEALVDPDKITIQEAIDLYREYNKRTLNEPRGCIKSNLKFIEEHINNTDRMLHHLKTLDLDDLMNIRLDRDNKPATIQQMFNTLRSVLNHADRLEFKIPVRLKYPKVKVNNGKLRYLTLEEEQRMLDELRPKDRSNRWRHSQLDAYELIIVLLDTGARYSEIAKLKWTDIDLDNRTIRLYRPKVDNESVLTMTDRDIRHYLDATGIEFLLSGYSLIRRVIRIVEVILI